MCLLYDAMSTRKLRSQMVANGGTMTFLKQLQYNRDGREEIVTPTRLFAFPTEGIFTSSRKSESLPLNRLSSSEHSFGYISYGIHVYYNSRHNGSSFLRVCYHDNPEIIDRHKRFYLFVRATVHVDDLIGAHEAWNEVVFHQIHIEKKQLKHALKFWSRKFLPPAKIDDIIDKYYPEPEIIVTEETEELVLV